MRSKMGNGLPKMGNPLPIAAPNGAGISYEQAIAQALRQELGGTNKAIKMLRRWTGAHERTVKNWLSASAGPGSVHLIQLMQASDFVFSAVLRLAARDGDAASGRIAEANELLKRAMALLEDRSQERH